MKARYGIAIQFVLETGNTSVVARMVALRISQSGSLSSEPRLAMYRTSMAAQARQVVVVPVPRPRQERLPREILMATLPLPTTLQPLRVTITGAAVVVEELLHLPEHLLKDHRHLRARA